ncbi:hypothetical protein [Mycolicibacterium brisbanense]|nr:hypothetical protein [Mycolicibacterium brisbanense]
MTHRTVDVPPASVTADVAAGHTGRPMGPATADDDATTEAAAWIADATRRLAGLQQDSTAALEDRWAQTGSTLTQLRAGIAHRIANLPRRATLIRTTRTGISVSHIALAKFLTWALAERAAAMTAAVADVELDITDSRLAAVYVHLIGVGTAPRDRTYLEDGDTLRHYAATVLRAVIGGTVEITAIWDDLVVPPPGE